MTKNFKNSKSFQKILSMILSFAMIFSFASQAFAFEIDDSLRGTKFEEAAEVLGALGIMVGDPDGSFRVEDGLKRSEFAKIAVHMLGLQDSAESAKNSVVFKDLTTDYWANGYINVAHDQGVVVGDPTGEYRPEDYITYQEAVTVFVRLAGYEPAAQSKGGYPQGYLSVANQYSFTKNATGTATSTISRGTTAIMANNTLTIGMMEQTGFGTSTNFEITDKTILEQYLDTKKLTGQVTANYFTGLLTSSGLDKDTIQIDNKVYKTTDENTQNLLGHNVTYYLQNNDKNEDIVILAQGVSGKNETMVIEGENIESVKDGKINYWKNKETDTTTKSEKYSDKVIMIYNGVAKDFDPSLIKGKGQLHGEIALLDNDSNGVYDIIFVNEYKNLVVESTSKLSFTISDKYGNKSLQLDPDNASLKFILQDKNGTEVKFDDLKEWQVISYLGSQESGVIIATVIENAIEGKVEEIENDEYKIGGKFYKIADNYKNTLKLDDQGVFYLDIMGRIAAVDANTTLSENYAYLINASESTDMNKYIKIKVFTKDGTVKVLQTTDRVRFNGTEKFDASEVLTKLKADGAVKKQIITYELNSDGEITRINTAEDLSKEGKLTVNEDKFVKNYENNKAVYNKTSGKLGLVNITDSTIVFDIPASAEDEDDYAIKNKSMFENDGEYDIEVFDVTEDFNAKVVLVKNSTGITNVESPIAVINKISSTINSKGEKIDKVYVAYNGEMVSFETSEAGILVNKDGAALVPGDVIQFRTNSQGAIDKINVLFEVKNKGTEFTKEDGDMKLYYGKVEKKFASSINVSVDGGAVENFSIANAKVVSVDTTKSSNIVSLASAGDIQKYDELSPRKVFVRVYDDVVQEVIIVR